MDILRQPALGRTAVLGTLYNIAEARFISNSEPLKFSHQMLYLYEQRGRYFQPIRGDTMREKFFCFGVLPELQLHILGGVLEIKGSGSYLRAEKNSARAVRVGVLYTITTKTDELQVMHPEFLKLNSKMKHSTESVSSNIYAVTEIHYGGRIMVSVEDRNEDERDASVITQELSALLTPFTEMFLQAKPMDERDFAHAEKLSWTVYSDFVEHAVKCPTLQDVDNQFDNVIQTLKYQNGGKGIPIYYSMINLRQCFNIAQPPFVPRSLKIKAEESKPFVSIFDRISMIKQRVRDVCDDVRGYKRRVTKEDFDFINDLQNKCQATHTEMWEALANAFLRANNEVSFFDVKIKLHQEFEAKVNHLVNCNLRFSRIREKVKLLGVMEKKGVKYCKTHSFYMKLRDNCISHCYILHCSNNERFSLSHFQDNLDAFLKMIDDKSHGVKSALFVFVDHDFTTNERVSCNVRIEHVKKGVVISEDMLADWMTNDKTVGKNDDKCIENCSVRGQMKSSYSGSSSFGKQCSDISTSAVDKVTEIKKSSGTQKPGFNENANKKAQDKTVTAVKSIAKNLNENSVSYVKYPSIGNEDRKMRSSEEGKNPENHSIKSELRPHPQEKEHKRSSECEVVPSKPKGNSSRDIISKTSVRRANSEKSSIIDKRNDNRCLQRNVSQAAQPRKKEATVLEKPKRVRKTSLEGQPRSDRDTSCKSPNAQVHKSCLAKKYPCPPSEPFEDVIVRIQDDSSKTINILIMGESGVGKSTWINGVANYISYSTVDEAAKSKEVYVINSSFLLTDDDYKEIVVRMGPEGDGKAKLGTSATQVTQSYTFSVGGRDVRLIDTPGIGDTRGVDKDQENFRNIFSHLSQFRNIHGICILLKPNSARMNTSFQFCIKELLAHLHTDACKNIVFVFTNSRGTFYRPGDTFPTLSNLLKENKGMDILLQGNERVYCMDNEPVRFLAATKQGMEFNDHDKANYANSWEVSRAETVRLIDYVSNLEPHAVEQSLQLNEVMKFSMKTAEPFVAFAKGLQFEIGRHRKHLYEVKEIENEQKLPSKMIVCCNTQCKRASQQDGNSGKYSSVCHHPCKNKYIQPNGKVGNKDVKECEVMDFDNGICRKCSCKWLVHMCIINKEVGAECHRESRSFKNQSSIAEDKVPSEVDRELVRLKTKLQFVLQNGAKLGIFLKQNAIGTSRDLIMEQLERTIEKEQELTALGEDVKGFKALSKVLALYISEARNLEKEMIENHQSISFSEIRWVLKNLYTC